MSHDDPMKNCRWQRLRLPLPDDRPAEEAGVLLGVGMVYMALPTKTGIWVCLKMLCTPKPNGFADHYPY